MKRLNYYLSIIAFVFVTALITYRSDIVADTLSYFKVNPGAANDINGNTGSNGYASVGVQGQQYFDSVVEPINGAYSEYAFGSITASYTTALTNSATLTYCKFRSSLDAAVLISYDGAANADYIGPGEVSVLDYKTNGIIVNSNISVKRYSGAASTGSLFISCGSY